MSPLPFISLRWPYISVMLTPASSGAALFEEMAAAAIDALPNPFRRHLHDVVLKVEDFADADTLRNLGIPSPWQLSGLYTGRPMTEESVWESGTMPATIHLYRQPILAEARQCNIPLADLIHHVVVHEVAHHFGYSDDEIYAIEASAQD